MLKRISKPQKRCGIALISFLMCTIFTFNVQAQQAVQSLSGTIVDQQSRYPIAHASIVLTIEGKQRSLSSKEDGSFRFANIPLGRFTLSCSHVGYQPQVISDVKLEAGKETQLTIELLEKVMQGKEVVITAQRERITDRQLSTASAEVFNSNDTRKYAGSRNDVSRMAANFAGVFSNNDSRNDIVIRGNAPSGLLWRIEGVDVPNPNHFAALGATGGPVSMINNSVLAQSAFYTGAFPAQFGNALSGAFDIRLRNGNAVKKEFYAQAGFSGLEAGVEGPFSKYSNSSYLLNYRYSIPALMKNIGISSGTGSGTPLYQDLTFKVNHPTKNAGVFTLFGLGGTSSIHFKGELSDTLNYYNDPYSNLKFTSSSLLIGTSHSYFFNENTSIKTILSATALQTGTWEDSLDRARVVYPHYRDISSEWKYAGAVSLNKKFSVKDRMTLGVTINALDFSLKDSVDNGNGTFKTLRNEEGTTFLYQSYWQWQHRFSDNLIFNGGAYYQALAFNHSSSLEPRAGLKFNTGKGTLSLAYGLHSQIQNMQAYFIKTPVGSGYNQSNRGLGFTKSNQLVFAWERTLLKGLHYKVEAYNQQLYDVPVEQRPSSLSLLNAGAEYGSLKMDSLINAGTGRNYGIEITTDKKFDNGGYFLSTISVFDSRFRGSDGVLRNTAFNGKYVFNCLAGKEWKISDKRTLAADIKITAAGGRMVTPVSLAASQAAHQAVYDTERAFEKQLKSYFRSDVRISYRSNGKHAMQEWFIDLQNISSNKNVFRELFDSRSNSMRTQYQLGFFPMLNYRIQIN